jgi:hypothetical protein
MKLFWQEEMLAMKITQGKNFSVPMIGGTFTTQKRIKLLMGAVTLNVDS